MLCGFLTALNSYTNKLKINDKEIKGIILIKCNFGAAQILFSIRLQFLKCFSEDNRDTSFLANTEASRLHLCLAALKTQFS